MDKEKLHKGMVFKNAQQLCDFMEIKRDKHAGRILDKLSLYCNWHKDKNKIIIDNVFDNPIIIERDFKYNVNDIIKNKFSNYIIIDRKIEQNKILYSCKCENNHNFNKHQYEIGKACPFCCGRITVTGESDISTTNPKLFSMLVDKEFGLTHREHSNYKVDWICPQCGNIVNDISPAQVLRFGLSCTSCSDGISYGEKFIYNLLLYLKIKSISQYSKTNTIWCDSYKYDFYINEIDCICECHGIQHYCENKQSLAEVQENDRNKELLANKYVSNYIILDCRYSELEWIKNSVMKSDLPSLLNFSENDIDWNLVHLNSLKSFVKISCDLWNKGKTIYEISDILGHGDAAIRSYLKQGEKVKLCDYNADLNRLLSYEKFKFNNSESKSKPIICNETNMLFRNISLCEKLSKEMLGVKLDHRNINSVLSGKRKHTGHYTFQYISKEKFNITKQTSPELVFGDFFILPDKQQSA